MSVFCCQGYGLIEIGGGVVVIIGFEECERYGSVGRLVEFMEAEIVDFLIGEVLLFG